MEARQTPKGKKTKERIIDASIGLIQEKGIDNVTLREICIASEIAQGTFYHYFKSMDEILLDIIRQEGEELHNLYSGIRQLPSSEQLKAILNFLYSYYELKGREIVAQLYRLETKAGHGESLIENLLPIRPLIDQIIEEGQKSGELNMSDDSDQYTHEIISLLLYCSFLWIRDSGSRTFTSFAKPKLDRVLRRIKSP